MSMIMRHLSCPDARYDSTAGRTAQTRLHGTAARPVTSSHGARIGRPLAGRKTGDFSASRTLLRPLRQHLDGRLTRPEALEVLVGFGVVAALVKVAALLAADDDRHGPLAHGHLGVDLVRLHQVDLA